MKTLYLIGGPMDVGKTAVCQSMMKKLQNSVFLDVAEHMIALEINMEKSILIGGCI